MYVPPKRRRRLLLASVLKPIHDVRMYEKIGQTLADAYEVHIAGYQGKEEEPVQDKRIVFHPMFYFPRHSARRLLANWQVWQKIQEVRPDALVIHTAELLPVAAWYYNQYRLPVVYDIQENYQANIVHQDIYPSPFKYALGPMVRWAEESLASSIAHFLLAERAYVQELPFVQGKHTLIENKLIRKNLAYTRVSLTRKVAHGQELRFVLAGTISTVYGVYEALDFVINLSRIYTRVTLSIIGKVAEQQVLDDIHALQLRYPFISLIGGEHLVMHDAIIREMRHADFVLLPYRPNLSTQDCIPTKMYECLGYGIPMIVQQNPLWEQFCKPYQAAVFIDFARPDLTALLRQLQQTLFYPNGPAPDVYWESEQPKLLSVFRQLLGE